MGFLEKFRQFMIGRYGFDTLSGFLLVLSVLLWLVNVFLLAIEMGLVALVVFRALSRNINMRALENRRFKKVYDPASKWVRLQIKKFRERKDYKYLKCPSCKAQLRVRNQKGDHGVRCPKCGNNFRVKI